MRPRVALAVTARPALDVIVGHVDHLLAAGWDVHVVVGEPNSDLLFPGCQLHCVPLARGRSPGQDVKAWRAMRSLWGRLTPDVVVAATPKASTVALHAAKWAGVPARLWWVWGLRGETHPNRWVRRAELQAAKAATSIVAASPSLADVLRAAGVSLEIDVLNAGAIAGIDIDNYPQPRQDSAERRPTCAFIGRLAGDKGISHLVTAWPKIRAAVPDAELALAGAPDALDHPRAAIDALAAQPGVRFLGHLADVRELLAVSDVLLLPSAREGLPAVVLEAAAFGVPTVAWDATGSRDAIVNGMTGELVPQGDVAALAERASTLLRKPQKAWAMGQAAREFVAIRFDKSQVERSFEAYLRNMLVTGHQENLSGQLVPHSGASADLEPARRG